MKKFVSVMLTIMLLAIPNLTIYANSNAEEEIKNIIESFYDVQYDAYLKMEYKDITPYLDMTQIQNQNKVIALKNLTARRNYIAKKGYAYVENRRFPLTFNYKAIDINDNQAKVIVELKIDFEKAYPPFISPGENVFKLEKEKGIWKIVEHNYEELKYYEGSKEKLLKEPTLSELFNLIDQEFLPITEKEYKNYDEIEKHDEIIVLGYPATNYNYSPSRGVEYANKYVYNRNTKFYEASVGGGDCTNFASQVLWYGFGANDTTNDIANKVIMIPGSYTDGWYAGPGGGSRNWENVDYFWNCMTSYKSINTPGPRVNVVSSISSLNNGGIMQIDFDYDNDYDHTVILVNKDSLLFAQHTSNGYRYFHDYTGAKRYFNPSHFREIK